MVEPQEYLCDSIKGVIGIFRGISVGIGLGHQIAVAVVGVGSHVTQSVHLLGGQAPTVELVQSDFPLVYVVLGIHPVESGLDQIAHGVILKEGGGPQSIDGLHHIAHAVILILGGVAVGVSGAGDVAHAVVGHGRALAIRRGGLNEAVQRIVLIDGIAIHSGHLDTVAVAVILVRGGIALSIGLGGHLAAVRVSVAGVTPPLASVMVTTRSMAS